MIRALPFIFWTAAFAAFLTPMELGDVWWHLKSGEWIWLEKGLPSEDPFSIFTGSRPFVLRAFWLCQLVLYTVHASFGFTGLLALKGLLFTASFILMHRLVSEHLEPPLSYIIMAPVVLIATGYDEIRPQSFSFMFFALTLYLLEKRKAPGVSKAIARNFNIALPAVMLIWANMHPGFVIGDCLIALYMAGVALRCAITKRGPEDPASLRTFFAVSALSIAASLVNPNGAAAFLPTIKMLLSSAANEATIHEHLPAREFAALTGERYIYVCIIAMVAAGYVSFLYKAVRMRLSGRPDMIQFVLFSALSALSLVTFRAGFFFALAAAAAIGKNLSGLYPSKRVIQTTAAAISAAAILTAALVLVPRSVLRSPVINENWIPAKAAAFLQAEELPGNLYHPYEWGGYLIWRLYPKYKVFIDGRALGSIAEYQDILTAKAGFDDTLKSKGVNTVMYWPLLPYRKRVPPVLFALLKDELWSPVYWDLKSVIFVRSALARNPIRKRAVWELLTSLIKAGIAGEPGAASHFVALGELYLERGFRRDAREAFARALELEPGNREAAFWLQALR